tara:strand:- start:2069 stop:2680 length:612 start_codon:yes stop_codon:yes gene_type:complete
VSDLNEIDDNNLVKLAANGDQQAFCELMNRHMDRVYNIAFRMTRSSSDADEVVQQTFIALLKKLKQFKGESQFTTWLTRVVINYCLNFIKKRNRQETPIGAGTPDEDSWEEAGEPEDLLPWQQNPEQKLQRKQLHELLTKALDRLDDKYRPVILLRDVEGHSTAETAESLGITESNVKIRLMRGRTLLRAELGQLMAENELSV